MIRAVSNDMIPVGVVVATDDVNVRVGANGTAQPRHCRPPDPGEMITAETSGFFLGVNVTA